jgi:hypothetical protein
MLFRYEHAPNSSFVPLFAASVTTESDRSHQLPAGECAQHVVIAARSTQAFAEYFDRRCPMFLGRLGKCARLTLESIQTQTPEGLGILRAQRANLYIQSLGLSSLIPASVLIPAFVPFRRAAIPVVFSLMLISPSQAQTPAPDPAQQKKILADATDYAFNHERSLPNFLCIQTTRRFQDYQSPGSQSDDNWRPLDIIVERLAYFEHHEDYKVMEINGAPSSVPHNKLGGASSSGEFGSVMKGIFAPETATDFAWQTWFTLRGRKMHVYAYHVAAAKSDYHVVVPEQAKDLVTAYHGLIFIDDSKHFIHRITLHADGIPPAFPIQDISLMLDYEYTRIGDATYLLPLTFELRSREGNVRVKNDVDYDQYRKFTADSSVTFSAPDVPTEQSPKK